MRLKRVIAVREPGLHVTVEITVDANNNRLGRDEIRLLSDELTDKTMLMVVDARYIRTPLSQIKVTR